MLSDERLLGISCYLSATVKYRMMMHMLKRKKRKISSGCLFWLGFMTVIAFLFFLNKDTIFSVLEKTNAKRIFLKDAGSRPDAPIEKLTEIQVQKTEECSNGDGSAEPINVQKAEDSLSKQCIDMQTVDPLNGKSVETELSKDTRSEQMPVPVVPSELIAANAGEGKEQPNEHYGTSKFVNPKKHKSTAVRKATIYWVRIDPDGKLIPMHVHRMLPQSDSPMSDALQVLFAAPSVSELKDGVRTLIPPRTKLRSAWVKDGIAFINVSEEFQFNQYGIDGAVAQLMQVVFTATEFATVKSVQFLIEGQKQDYLGAEGAWIGSPLSRTSF